MFLGAFCLDESAGRNNKCLLATNVSKIQRPGRASFFFKGHRAVIYRWNSTKRLFHFSSFFIFHAERIILANGKLISTFSYRVFGTRRRPRLTATLMSRLRLACKYNRDIYIYSDDVSFFSHYITPSWDRSCGAIMQQRVKINIRNSRSTEFSSRSIDWPQNEVCLWPTEEYIFGVPATCSISMFCEIVR